VVLSVLGLIGAASVLFTAAILFVLVGIAYKPTHPVQAGALSAMGAVLLAAGPGRPGRLGRTPPARHAAGLRDGPRVDVSALAQGQTDDVVTVEEKGDP
jgi:hypothetical protein